MNFCTTPYNYDFYLSFSGFSCIKYIFSCIFGETYFLVWDNVFLVYLWCDCVPLGAGVVVCPSLDLGIQPARQKNKIAVKVRIAFPSNSYCDIGELQFVFTCAGPRPKREGSPPVGYRVSHLWTRIKLRDDENKYFVVMVFSSLFGQLLNVRCWETLCFLVLLYILYLLYVTFIKSRVRETQTLSTDADSRTDTILERLRDLPIRTEKRTWSTQKCGLSPH